MSQSKVSGPANGADASSQKNEEGPAAANCSMPFERVWSEFYSKMAGGDLTREQALKCLETINRLLFGADEEKKDMAVKHGSGVLELIVEIVNKYGEDEEVAIAGLKAVKCCVIRNPSGRSRCRRAQVLSFIDSTLSKCIDKKFSDRAAEEGLTTLSAICMGDDLNAWQASIQLHTAVQTLQRTANTPTATQMTTYLLSLFQTVADVPQETPAPKHFFQNLAQAESLNSEADTALVKNQHGFAEGKYNAAFNLVTNDEYIPKLLYTFVAQLLAKRGICRLETGYYESALNDAELAMKFDKEAGRRLRLTAMVRLGRAEEVRQDIADFLIQNPNDEDLNKTWRELQNASSSSTQNRE